MENRLQSVLVYLRQDDELLLGYKKRGHGMGNYNGAGGKLLDGETAEDAARRECKEEFGIDVKSLQPVGLLHFFQEPHIDEASDQDVTVFLCSEWEGEPVESEELAPQWFKLDSIPYDRMWADDPHWLPQVLAGKAVEGTFHFDGDYNLVTWDLKETEPWQ